MRNTAPKDAAELDALETREWLESLDYVLQTGGPARVAAAAARADAATRGQPASSCRLPPTRPTSTRSPPKTEPPLPGSREIERRIKSLVRWNALAMVVRANKPDDGIGGHISTLRLGGDALRGRLQPLLPGQGRRPRRRHHLLPGPRGARHLRARVSRRPAVGRAARELPPRAAAGRRALVVSASVADAGLLGVPDGVDGPRPDHGDLPGALHALPRGSRAEDAVGLEGLGVPRRRRDRRARIARRDHAGVAREARQPDLRHQLQPAAARRSGARQRPDHPGARGDLPRRRLERHQGDLGQRVGSAARRRITTACSSSAWARSSTASIRSTPSSPAPTSASTSGAPIRGCSRWSSTCPTSS